MRNDNYVASSSVKMTPIGGTIYQDFEIFHFTHLSDSLTHLLNPTSLHIISI